MIGEVIKHHRLKLKYSQSELAGYLGLSASSIGMYEQNRRMPDVETLKKMASIFDCSVDQLLGIDDLKKDSGNGYDFYSDKHAVNSVLEMRIGECLSSNNISIDVLAEKTGIDNSRLSEIIYTSSLPTIIELLNIARVLNVSLDFLLAQAPNINSSEKKLLSAFTKLNEDNKDIIIGKTKELLKEQQYEEDNLFPKASAK